MDQDKVQYILRYFMDLMTDHEISALKNHMYTSKTSDNSTLRNIMTERKWIDYNPEIVKLLESGYDEFELFVATRIMDENPEKVIFNNCPKCGKLARTPYAKQCRFCSYDWH